MHRAARTDRQPEMVHSNFSIALCSTTNGYAGKWTELHSVFFAEFIDATCGIQDLLLAGVERVTGRTHIKMQLFRKSRLGRKFVAAAADYFYVVVLRMNLRFHNVCPVTTG
jgi:hypothetical protein